MTEKTIGKQEGIEINSEDFVNGFREKFCMAKIKTIKDSLDTFEKVISEMENAIKLNTLKSKDTNDSFQNAFELMFEYLDSISFGRTNIDGDDAPITHSVFSGFDLESKLYRNPTPEMKEYVSQLEKKKINLNQRLIDIWSKIM